ncbi:hypothetical protein FOXG_20883 [Fusarium oxysporum f. sp. lycopersici 4287]|uniref:Uncharacterized protein n=1 Tax=Fusarium oxysporum f. sp. lycopersici (strain 4287 / CBS 123668 / FGSC 9935 / NRRL 34936) TaxID=426428 RepID=A0A0J9WS56_FUSO4|nr:hypothetical protein FOXG_20883 [Fusarium oxysporum f. sp. lycopersici 4287]KNB13697.1 hypothetical protein FOXG_20883 [Fusarium oxysporum f. sp. lycopersici 4287]
MHFQLNRYSQENHYTHPSHRQSTVQDETRMAQDTYQDRDACSRIQCWPSCPPGYISRQQQCHLLHLWSNISRNRRTHAHCPLNESSKILARMKGSATLDAAYTGKGSSRFLRMLLLCMRVSR